MQTITFFIFLGVNKIYCFLISCLRDEKVDIFYSKSCQTCPQEEVEFEGYPRDFTLKKGRKVKNTHIL